MGAELSSTGTGSPVRGINTEWLATATSTPLRNTASTGSETAAPVSSLRSRNTSVSGRVRASSRGHPVSRSATGFINVTMPCASVEMTASPMLDNVTRNRSRLSAISSPRARARASDRASAKAIPPSAPLNTTPPNVTHRAQPREDASSNTTVERYRTVQV